jgi:hypothetical protein
MYGLAVLFGDIGAPGGAIPYKPLARGFVKPVHHRLAISPAER